LNNGKSLVALGWNKLASEWSLRNENQSSSSVNKMGKIKINSIFNNFYEAGLFLIS